jgi:hypothetical protein
LGFLADIGHRQGHPLGHPCAKGDARRLAAGDVVEGLGARFAQDGDGQEIHQDRPNPGIGNQLAAIDVSGRLLARGMGEGRRGVEADRPHIQEHPRGQAGDLGGVDEG